MHFSRRSFLRLSAACAATMGVSPWAGAQSKASTQASAAALSVLAYDRFAHHVERFNSMEPERLANLIPNADAWTWMQANCPAFECPDATLEEIYWYRWWTFRKALVRTPEGPIAPMEFFGRAPVSSALGHHLMEGRWLRDRSYLDDTIRYWFGPGRNGAATMDNCKYSSWTIWASRERWKVTGDTRWLTGLLDTFVSYYAAWEHLRLNADGSFWQFDVRDAMEESISGSRRDHNLRPTLNSYMFGNAEALAQIAALAGRNNLRDVYAAKADGLRQFVQERLWDEQAKYFKVRFVHPGQPTDDTLCDAREAIGFIPWYFDLPAHNRGYEAAWEQFGDPQGFKAPFGITTAERRHPRFRFRVNGECEWNGPVWPFATSQTLTALANVLHDRDQRFVTRADYFDALRTYARCTYRDGKPYIGEYFDEVTGAALHDNPERGRYYNHSTFCDLVISGLVGLRSRDDDHLVVHPLLPDDTWDWFCLDGVPYRGRSITILWDRTGTRYERGSGLQLLVDGVVVARSDRLARISGALPAT